MRINDAHQKRESKALVTGLPIGRLAGHPRALKSRRAAPRSLPRQRPSRPAA
jgi:hypothetical protein